MDDAARRERPTAGPSLDSTAELLVRVRDGDRAARERLLARMLPALRRWAHGRLPAFARSLVDTDDLVQVTLVRTLNRLGEFEPEFKGALMAYVRRALLNQIRDEIRKARRRPERAELPDDVPDAAESPLDRAVGRETVERYERALAKLPPEQQEAVVLRIEMGFTYREVAEALAKPSMDAARMTVARAVARLARELRDGA